MRLTVVFPDSTITVDGMTLKVEEMPVLGGAGVIQWDGDELYGQVEGGTHNGPFRDPKVVEPYLDAFHAAMRRRMDGLGTAHAGHVVAHTDLERREAKEQAEREASQKKARDEALEREAEDLAKREQARAAAQAQVDAQVEEATRAGKAAAEEATRKSRAAALGAATSRRPTG